MKQPLLELLSARKPLSWRRVTALAVATALLSLHLIDQWGWVVVCGLFLGGEAAERVAWRLAESRGELPEPRMRDEPTTRHPPGPPDAEAGDPS